jgi:hypothetical protein
MDIAIYRELTRLTRSLSRIVCRGQEDHKGSKGTLWSDFQQIPDQVFFKPMSSQDAG